MGIFKKWREKRKEKQKTNELKPPSSSYEIYNQNETLTLQTDLKGIDKFEKDEDLKVLDTTLETKTTTINKKTNTRTTTIKQSKTKEIDKKEKNMSADKKGRNIYYVSVRKDKTGKKIGWEVKKENADKITKLCNTKEEAIEFVKEKAGNQGSTCIIRKVDGSIDKTLKFGETK